MDTKLKKFNSTIVLKVIAFMLCLSCAVNCTTQAMTSFYKATESGLKDNAYEDALYELLMIDRDVTETETFKYHMSRFSGVVGTMTGSYGDGSEEAYNRWKNGVKVSRERWSASQAKSERAQTLRRSARQLEFKRGPAFRLTNSKPRIPVNFALNQIF